MNWKLIRFFQGTSFTMSLEQREDEEMTNKMHYRVRLSNGRIPHNSTNLTVAEAFFSGIIYAIQVGLK